MLKGVLSLLGIEGGGTCKALQYKILLQDFSIVFKQFRNVQKVIKNQYVNKIFINRNN